MGSIQENEPLVSVRGLRTHFAKTGRLAEHLLGRPNEAVRAVDGVDLEIRRGEVLGLVGESGSGKTTLGKTILRLVPATAGDIFFERTNVTNLQGRRLGSLRRRAQMVHQDPHASLSPRLRVSTQLTEPYRIHNVPEAGRRAVAELLDMVGLPEDLASTYPHELSGGQARRVGIARALALEPALLVADEPTAGLDVSAAGGILNLLRDLAEQLDLTCLVVSHDLNVVDYLTDRVAVMYLGKIFEVGPTEQIFEAPAHPYTRALLSSAPEANPRQSVNGPENLLAGELPNPKHPPTACRFHPRCPFADDRSRTTEPTLEEVANDHIVACHHWERIREESLTGTDGSPAA